jgi:hypothetical protein
MAISKRKIDIFIKTTDIPKSADYYGYSWGYNWYDDDDDDCGDYYYGDYEQDITYNYVGYIKDDFFLSKNVYGIIDMESIYSIEKKREIKINKILNND